MNRGEGLRYAAHAKSGQINLFKEQKKKTKKFGYKGRGQQFSVRKIQTQDSVPEKQPPSKTPLSAPATAATKKATKPQVGNRKAPAEQKSKPTSRKDFVKKNAQSAPAGKAKKEAAVSSAAGGGNTVTLTQDQLNAILATIGKAGGSSEIPNISFDNGNIKVDTTEETQDEVRNQSSKKKSTKRPEPEIETDGNDGDAANVSQGNISSLLAKGKDTSESFQGKDTGNQSSQSLRTSVNEAPKERTKSLESGAGNPHRKDDHERTQSKVGVASSFSHMDKKPPAGSPSGYGDVSSIIGLNQRELAEKKKQQWKRELDEQIAMKRQQQGKSGGNRGGRGRDDEPQTWAPWGQPGSGAPSRSLNASMNLDLSSVTSAEQSDGLPSASKSKDPMSSQITPRGDVTSSLGKLATQKYTPAAMRSSFIIGGDPIDSHNMTVKQLEKKQWLEELERQRKEAKDRKEQEKRKRQEFDDRLTSQWAEQVTSPRSKSVAHTQGKHTATVDDIVVKQTLEANVQMETRHHSADAVPSGREDDLSLKSHIRPAGLLVDPVEAERKGQQRQKHLEHMMAVKAQVEERQRQKREAMEAKKREEAEEERKLAAERDALQKQFEMEKEKQRKKEEAAAAKQKALLESVQAAYERAQHDKHQKRVEKLAQQGHNVDNLRRSWDATHISPETSPRVQPGHHPVRHSPHLEPIIATTTTTNTSSPRQSITHDPSPRGQPAASVVTHDASTSPVFDQAVQTDFQFPPSGVLLEQAFEIQREASAGVEYKPDKQNKRKPDGQKKSKGQDKGVKGEEKSKRPTKGKAQEIPEEETKSKRTSAGVKNRPIWGQTNQRKKKQGNSEKDLTGNQKKREERRKQRMEELMALQEKSAPKRLTEKKKAASVPQSRTASVAKADSKVTPRAQNVPTRAATEIDLKRRETTPSDAWASDKDVELPPSPPLHSGDFVPFLRHDEELNERSIPGSPASRQRTRTRGRENQTGSPKTEKTRSSSVDKRDPLLNPERLKDSNLRQEKILEQLSNLRQGLMMKQRELEIGLSTPLVM